MGLRQRLEREWRTAMRQVADAAAGGGQVNRATKMNAVVVHNTGGGVASATAEQTAPIVQGPHSTTEEAPTPGHPGTESGGPTGS